MDDFNLPKFYLGIPEGNESEAVEGLISKLFDLLTECKNLLMNIEEMEGEVPELISLDLEFIWGKAIKCVKMGWLLEKITGFKRVNRELMESVNALQESRKRVEFCRSITSPRNSGD